MLLDVARERLARRVVEHAARFAEVASLTQQLGQQDLAIEPAFVAIGPMRRPSRRASHDVPDIGIIDWNF